MRIILVDGECSICQRSVQFIMKRDQGTFHFASLQSEIGQYFVQQHHLEHVDSVVLIDSNKAYIYSSAVLKIVRYLRFPWKLLSVLFIIPAIIRNPIYHFIAKNRHRFQSKTSVCRLLTEEERTRFLSSMESLSSIK